jgi:hypothetical protein
LNLVAFYGKESSYSSLNFEQGALDGTFLVNATVNPAQLRLSRNHEWCLAKFVEKKLKADKAKKEASGESSSNPIVEMLKKL